MDWCTLLFWTLDMVQGFFLAYYKDGKYISNNCQVFIHYMKTGFLIDCIVVVPEWCITLLNMSGQARSAGDLGKIFKGARAVRALRVLRTLKFKAILNRIYDIIQSEYTFMVASLTQLFAFILLCNHVIACIWYAIGVSYWNSGHESWLDRGDIMLHPNSYRYGTALHWALTQFTPAGMGVSAVNFGERIFSILVLLLAMIAFSSIVGSITGFMTEIRRMSHNENKQSWLLRLYLKQNNVKLPLASRIEKYIDHQHNMKKDRIQRAAVTCLKELSQELHYELTHQVSSHQLLLHPLFDFINTNMKSVIWTICCSALTSHSFAQREEIFHYYKAAKNMFLLKVGNLEYVPYTTQLPLDPQPQAREPISEGALWTKWRHQGQLTALTPSELISVDPDAFSKAMLVHPHPWCVAVSYAERFVDFLNGLEPVRFIDILRETDFHMTAIHTCSTSWKERYLTIRAQVIVDQLQVDGTVGFDSSG